MSVLVQGNTIVTEMFLRQAELWALRAWLSLEAGHIDRAREQARKALALGPGPKGGRKAPWFTFDRMALLVLDLIENRQEVDR
jgi:hypothetical protein